MIEKDLRLQKKPQKTRSRLVLPLLLGCFVVVIVGIVAVALLPGKDAGVVDVPFNSRRITVDDIIDWTRVCDNLAELRQAGEFDCHATTLQAFASEMRARMPEMAPWCEVVGVTLESFILASDAIARTTTLDEVEASAGIGPEEEEAKEVEAEEPPFTPDKMWEVPEDMPADVMDRLRAVYERQPASREVKVKLRPKLTPLHENNIAVVRSMREVVDEAWARLLASAPLLAEE